MVVLDTSIIIDHLRMHVFDQESRLMRLVSQLSGEELAISLITVQELYTGRSSRENEKEKDMLAVISPLKMLPITYQIVKTAGCVARDFDKRPMTMSDALIAATCLEYEAELATLNERDFARIPRLRLLSR